MSLLFSTGVIAASGLAKGAPGMVLLKPTSITHTGTSATLGANGQVTFSAVSVLSLNGVFSADFDNYYVTMRLVAGVTNIGVFVRWRAAGTDDSTSNSYVTQEIEAANTSVNGARTTSNQQSVAFLGTVQRSGFEMQIYGPYLAQPTVSRAIGVFGVLDAYLLDNASTHNQSTSYDGMTFRTSSSDITGAVQVYGIRS